MDAVRSVVADYNKEVATISTRYVYLARERLPNIPSRMEQALTILRRVTDTDDEERIALAQMQVASLFDYHDPEEVTAMQLLHDFFDVCSLDTSLRHYPYSHEYQTRLQWLVVHETRRQRSKLLKEQLCNKHND